MMLIHIIIAIIFGAGTAGLACHPECHWQCDDPVEAADCSPRCESPNCEYNCDDPKHLPNDKTPNCIVRCPEDQCELDECPQCETICYPPRHLDDGCHILCEALVCEWDCREPTIRKPICELVCEQPTCAADQSMTPLVAPLRLLVMVSVCLIIWIQTNF